MDSIAKTSRLNSHSLMWWAHVNAVMNCIASIYYCPTQQTIGCNDFYNDMFRLTRVIVTLHSETFGVSSIINYTSGDSWSV
jgi:hypothetical protein